MHSLSLICYLVLLRFLSGFAWVLLGFLSGFAQGLLRFCLGFARVLLRICSVLLRFVKNKEVYLLFLNQTLVQSTYNINT